jgi:hypothetical protein
MIIYLDENLPPHLAEGFDVLQQPEGLKIGHPLEVKYLPHIFGQGAKDMDWIPKLTPGSCVITQDINIHRRKHELELYRKHGVGMFFLKGKSKKQGMSVWGMVQALAKNWPEISRIVHEVETPFAYQVSLGRGVKKL